MRTHYIVIPLPSQQRGRLGWQCVTSPRSSSKVESQTLCLLEDQTCGPSSSASCFRCWPTSCHDVQQAGLRGKGLSLMLPVRTIRTAYFLVSYCRKWNTEVDGCQAHSLFRGPKNFGPAVVSSLYQKSWQPLPYKMEWVSCLFWCRTAVASEVLWIF